MHNRVNEGRLHDNSEFDIIVPEVSGLDKILFFIYIHIDISDPVLYNKRIGKMRIFVIGKMRRFVKIWKGDFMQDYEELYREARRKYDYACDQINAYNGLIAGAQEQRKNKVNRINELNGSTKKIRAAIDDLKEVLKREEKVTEKYKKVVKEIDAASDNFSSMVDDSEVSNRSLNDVFSAEASGTKSAIENVFQTVRERKGTLESNLEEQKQELQRAKEDLSDIDSNIRYYKNERDAWKRIKTNNYYNMEYYKRKIP